MPVIPSGQNLFVVDLEYIVPLAKIDTEIDAHVAFLEANYAAGRFIVSGPKVPRIGGVIIATAKSREVLEAELEADPFKQKNLARYTVTEFLSSMAQEALKG